MFRNLAMSLALCFYSLSVQIDGLNRTQYFKMLTFMRVAHPEANDFFMFIICSSYETVPPWFYGQTLLLRCLPHFETI